MTDFAVRSKIRLPWTVFSLPGFARNLSLKASFTTTMLEDFCRWSNVSYCLPKTWRFASERNRVRGWWRSNNHKVLVRWPIPQQIKTTCVFNFLVNWFHLFCKRKRLLFMVEDNCFPPESSVLQLKLFTSGNYMWLEVVPQTEKLVMYRNMITLILVGITCYMQGPPDWQQRFAISM